ncbi:helix-turn-helix domain-containing protein [Nocardia sp. alder85J]|uniref:helix-turn-helix domain-containing protein n=1 Tax=Nocardia sp. alder85J TaxID=2862949 RepID=UPI001CD31577|nr:helix-turn-helix domain-containing protein [Nocardia sp. alder85J]MCX4098349.1 helix-turn-helix domain-containing protein [Nocardia sp. alder85J]
MTTHPPAPGRACEPARMPDLYEWLYCARRRRGMSREAAARRADISYSYLTRIEREHLRPTRDVLDSLTFTYHLDPWQQRHTRELWEPSMPLPAAGELRHHLSDPAVLAYMDHLSARDILAAHIDPLSTVLHGNHAFHRHVPGLTEHADTNLALWLFTPTARQVIDHWDHEARHGVTLLRGALGRYRDTPQARSLLRKLRQHNNFNELWAETRLHVTYGRTTATPIRLHDSTELVPLSLQVTEYADRNDILIAYGITDTSE